MQVRANSLQELVYKQGQAGITKATVSIVFNNEDKGQGKSPVGYEHLDEITVTRQLVIGGRSKYLINGKVAEPRCAGWRWWPVLKDVELGLKSWSLRAEHGSWPCWLTYGVFWLLQPGPEPVPLGAA